MRGHRVENLAVFVLFAVFTVCVVSVVFIGVGTYKRICTRDAEVYNNRICTQYIMNRVRQAEAVSIEDFRGTQALVLQEGGYIRRVYCYQGYLMELFSGEGADLIPEAGDKIAEAESFSLEFSGNVLRVTGIGDEFVVYVRGTL